MTLLGSDVVNCCLRNVRANRHSSGLYASRLPMAGSVRRRIQSAPSEVNLKTILIDADPFPRRRSRPRRSLGRRGRSCPQGLVGS